MTCLACGGAIEGRSLQCDPCRTGERPRRKPRRPSAPALEPSQPGEVRRLVLPWDVLVSDNKHHGGNGWTTERYRTARDMAQAMAIAACRGQAPLVGPVSVTARVWVPDQRRRDVLNFAKLVHDAMQGAAYHNDSQIVRPDWQPAGLDPERPRVEVEVRAMSETESAA